MRLRYPVFAAVIAFVLSLPGSAPDTLQYRVYNTAYREYFNVLGWMAGELRQKLFEGHGSAATTAPDRGADLVRNYLNLNERIAAATPRASSNSQPADAEAFKKIVEERDQLEPEAQLVLRRQVESVLREQGLTSTIAGRAEVFPPTLFSFTPLPRILVISPKDNIRIATTLALRPGLTWGEADAIEQRASKLNYAALVVPIGGLGAYPPMLPRTSNLEFLAQTIAHEWSHNYLTFHPLGFRYTLQIEKDYDVVTMNETTASIIGEEIGDRVLNEYYGYPVREHARKPEPSKEPETPAPPVESDFNKRMRTIRLKVDDLLANGQVAEAEKYMADEQESLQADGYDIRKLNQAYFAFYGSYATSPGFTNPLGDAVAELRYESPSLKAFVDRIEEMRSYGELKAAIGN